MHPIPPEKLGKYVKARVLRDDGTPGNDAERAVAARVCARMEQEHPGIDQAADAVERMLRARTQPGGLGATPEAAWFHRWVASGGRVPPEAFRPPGASFGQRVVNTLAEAVYRELQPKIEEALTDRAVVDWLGGFLDKYVTGLRAWKEEPMARADYGAALSDGCVVLEETGVFEEDHGRRYVELHFQMPLDLWERTLAGKTTARTLVEYLDAALDLEEGEGGEE